MGSLFAVGDVVKARGLSANDRWSEALVREVVIGSFYGRPCYEYKVAFRTKRGDWSKRARWAEVAR